MTYHARILLTLISLPKVGGITARKIIDELKFKVRSVQDFLDLSSDSSLLSKLSVTENDILNAISKVDRIEEMSEAAGVKVISVFDEFYPKKLHRLKKPPVVLNYIGDITLLNERKTCAIIGTRNPTPHGYEYGLRIGQKLGEQGIVVISGLAVGCDTSGHLGCLNGKGQTVAVLAQGLRAEKIYPKQNRELAQQILDMGGLLLSEYTIDQAASPNLFVERDRIQAGLSDCVIVVETGIKGGTMHTVKFSNESSVPLAAYNHPEKYRHLEQTMGNQLLIKDGKATGVYSLEELNQFLSRAFSTDQNFTTPYISNQPLKTFSPFSIDPPVASELIISELHFTPSDEDSIPKKENEKKKRKTKSKKKIDPEQSKLF